MPTFFSFTKPSGRRFIVNVSQIESVFETTNGGYALSMMNMPDDIRYDLTREDYCRLLKILGFNP
jgi:hypothetical protein